MGSRFGLVRGFLLAAALTTVHMLGGCEASNPNAVDEQAPVLGPNTPKSSEEAAIQSEPPASETNPRSRRSR